MNKKLGHNLAGKLFNLSRRGGKFSPAAFKAAERLYKGTGTETDLGIVRQALGIRKSGASDARGQLRGIRKAMGTMSDIGESYDQLARGNVMTGIAGMMRTGVDLGSDFLTSKWLKTKLEDTAGQMLGDAARGTRAFYSLGRMVRVGGGIAAAATMGWEIGSAIRESRSERAAGAVRNQGLGFDLMRQQGLDAETSRANTLAARGALRRSNKFYGVIEDTLGLDMGLQGSETELRTRMAKVTAGIVDAIQKGEMQVQNKGVIEEILADDTLGPAAKRRKLQEYTNTAWDPGMAGVGMEDRIQTEAALRRSRTGDWFGTGTVSDEERTKIILDLQERDLKQIQLRKQARARAAEDLDERLNTPEQRRFREEQADLVSTYWGERRRAHQAQAVD